MGRIKNEVQATSKHLITKIKIKLSYMPGHFRSIYNHSKDIISLVFLIALIVVLFPIALMIGCFDGGLKNKKENK